MSNTVCESERDLQTCTHHLGTQEQEAAGPKRVKNGTREEQDFDMTAKSLRDKEGSWSSQVSLEAISTKKFLPHTSRATCLQSK